MAGVDLARLLPNLPSLSDVHRLRAPKLKGEQPTRLAEKVADAKADERAERAWKAAIWKRDKGRCRACDRKVVRSLALVNERGECHHLERRENKVTRWDSRNGLLCCAGCHERITHGKLHIIGSARQMFQVDGKSYLNADLKLRFQEVK